MKQRSFKISNLLLLSLFFLGSCTGPGEKNITIIGTTDIHGVILPYDFIEKKNLSVSLASMAAYIKNEGLNRNSLVLLDNGDNLQGQPPVYYYNFIDTVSRHILAEAFNYLGYDAITVGNHDIEAGHSVYDRLVKEYNFPMLAANAVDISSGDPYFKPYTIIEKNGIRIAVFGLITPLVPTWLPPELYSGMEFRDMRETAEHWMPVIMKENPDLVVGLFHSGWDEPDKNDLIDREYSENGSYEVAYYVPGFDIILNGHDHRIINKKIVNINGDTVLILNGGSRSEKIMRADVIFSSGKLNNKKNKSVTGTIIEADKIESDPEFISEFASHQKTIQNYVDKVIAVSGSDISSRDSYFGPSAFVDMIHSVQLDITGADVSFAAPLSFDVKIAAGPVTVGDMFKLYRFENMLYTVTMTGEEIRKYLEYSYSEWLNTMKGPDEYLLKLRLDKDGKPQLVNGEAWLRNQPYNFDSGAGLVYVVDVSKPEGSRVDIKSMADGSPFADDKWYKVAVNSYRGSGGGGHFPKGAGLDQAEVLKRLVSSTDRDLRFYILDYLEKKKTIEPAALNNWKIIPESWIKTAAVREYKLLFGEPRFNN